MCLNCLYLCEHLSGALSRCVLHSVVGTSAHMEVRELAFSDAVRVDRAFILSVLFLYQSRCFCLSFVFCLLDSECPKLPVRVCSYVPLVSCVCGGGRGLK